MEEKITISFIRNEDKYQLKELVPQELLGEDGLIICALAGEDFRGVLAAQSMDEQAWDIPFLYVVESSRRRGVAKDMLRLLRIMARPAGVQTIHMSCVQESVHDDLVLFAEAVGFAQRNSSSVFDAGLEEVNDSVSGENKLHSFDGEVLRLKDATDKQWKMLLREMDIRRLKNEDELQQIYMELENKEHYDRDISCLAVNSHGMPAGVILVESEEKYIAVDYLCNLRSALPQISLHLIRAACEAAGEKYKGNKVKVRFHAYNPLLKKMLDRMLGKNMRETGHAVYMVMAV